MYLDSKYNVECCGCTACESICSKAAIRMERTERGFFYPVVAKERCVLCNICRNVCKFNQVQSWNNSVLAAYGMHHKDPVIMRTSRSGGAFYMFAQEILRMRGSVWGAAFNSRLDVVHTKVTDIEGLSNLQGSKYVQSNLGNSFSIIYEELNDEKSVLFSGTACQVAGLLGYLDIKNCSTDKLITCDIVCQGVPSPKVFSDYRKYLEKKHGSKLIEFKFRDASRIGWEGHEESYKFDGKRKQHFSRKYANYYYKYFMRESCFECKYTGLHRPADFSLADFWGVKENYPYFANSDGNSLILINTEKGKHFFEKAKQVSNTLEVEIAKCLQPRLKSPCTMPEGYERFWVEYNTKGYEYCIKKYGKESFKSKLVYKFKPILSRIKLRR